MISDYDWQVINVLALYQFKILCCILPSTHDRCHRCIQAAASGAFLDEQHVNT